MDTGVFRIVFPFAWLFLFSSCILNPLFNEQTRDLLITEKDRDIPLLFYIPLFLSPSSAGTDTDTSTTTDTMGITYGSTSYVFEKGSAITDQVPTITGGNPDGCSVNPALPSGLSLDGSTCTISGTPQEGWSATDHTISVTSGNQSGATVVNLRVREWKQQAYLKASNAEAGDQFGLVVAVNGDTAAVSTIQESSQQTTITNGTGSSSLNTAPDSGAVYVYRRTGNEWAQEAYVKASNCQASDYFGTTIDINGDILVVGAPGEDSWQTFITSESNPDNYESASGAVYVYRRTGNEWAQEAFIKASNAESFDQFGYAVALDGDTIVVSAMYEDSNQTIITNGTGSSNDNSAQYSGAIYVYRKTSGSWTQEAYIKASNAEKDDQFGTSLSVNEDTIAVGARREDSNQTTITNGTGSSSDNSASDTGAIYVYRRTGTTWVQEAYIKASNGEGGDLFGSNVDIHGDTIVVGNYLDDSSQTTITNGTGSSSDNNAAESGAVYVYRRTGSTWTQEAYIKAVNAESKDGFGKSVAISGETLVVGAYREDGVQRTITNGSVISGDNDGANSGAAYVYKRTGTTWVQQAYIKASNADIGDYFGGSVAIDNNTIIASALWEDSGETTITNGSDITNDYSASAAGAAYIFVRE